MPVTDWVALRSELFIKRRLTCIILMQEELLNFSFLSPMAKGEGLKLDKLSSEYL